MKKKLFFSLLLSLLVIISVSFGAFAATKITLIVNGTKANVEPISIDGVTYIPLRSAADLLGVEINWDGSTRTVTLNSSDSNAVKKEIEDTTKTNNVVYKNCADVKAAGNAPLLKGQPGYSQKLDRDGDGVACET